MTPPDGPSMKLALAGRNNGFGFLRLVLATLVIVDHAFPLGGFGRDPMWAWSREQDSIGGICVAGFFAISGFLITRSSFQTDWLQFLWRRGLRIFPGYWAVLIVAAFLVAPSIWWTTHGQELAGFFARNGISPFAYVYRNATLEVRRYGIHDLLARDTPYGQLVGASVFNGSLWTLIYEWRCYLLVAVLAICGGFRRWPLVGTAVALFSYALLLLELIVPSSAGRIAPWLGDVYTVRFSAIFMMGSVAAMCEHRLPCDDRLGIAAVIVFAATLLRGGYFALGYPALTYALLWLAARLPDWCCKVGARNDYSYGTYLYGFLVQQVLAFLGVHRAGLVLFVVVAVAVTYACAWVSWHLVEKPALGLKSRGPGKGTREWVASLRRAAGWDRREPIA